jgi:hypothetical protein
LTLLHNAEFVGTRRAVEEAAVQVRRLLGALGGAQAAEMRECVRSFEPIVLSSVLEHKLAFEPRVFVVDHRALADHAEACAVIDGQHGRLGQQQHACAGRKSAVAVSKVR